MGIIQDLQEEVATLEARIKELEERNQALIEAHIAFQKWEGDIALDDNCWNPNGDIMMLDEKRINQLMALQRRRMIALNPEYKEMLDAFAQLLGVKEPTKQ